MSTRARRVLRRTLVVIAFLAAAIVPPLAWGVTNLFLQIRAHSAPPVARPLPPSLPHLAHDPAKRTAVVVTGNGGAEMTDFLIPYEALATTGAFNTYVVAPERRVVPLASAAFLDGGYDLVPHYGLADYDREIGRAPDVIVIPFLPKFQAGEDHALVPWIRQQAERGALVVTICAGTEVLAATGLLDGQRATTHPSFLARFADRYPDVVWLPDVRYVETERTISSGAIASGMDATLAAIRKLLGRPAADAVARTLHYPHTRFLDDPAYPSRVSIGSMVGAAFATGRTDAGVMLYDGISELAIGSVFDTYPATLHDRLVAIAEEPDVIETAHGMWLLPRHTLADAPTFDRVIVPGTRVPGATGERVLRWSEARGVGVAFVHANANAFAYDGPLADLAERDSALVATGVAINLNYPIEHLTLPGAPISVGILAIPLLASAFGVGSLVLLRRWLRTRRARRMARTAMLTVMPSPA